MIDNPLRDALRTTLRRHFMPHTYTLTKDEQGASTGEDAYGNPTYAAATPTSGKPCRYVFETQGSREGIVRTSPQLLVPYDDTIDEGDEVSAVRDSNGVVIAQGPLRVDDVSAIAGFGPTLQKLVVLQRTEITRA